MAAGVASTKKRLEKIARDLYAAQTPVRVLRGVSWMPEVKQRFFADRAQEMPRVSYAPFDCQEVCEQVGLARARIGHETHADAWLSSVADSIEHGARLLQARGKPEFLRWSTVLYGQPSSPIWDGHANSLDLAHRLADVLESLCGFDLNAEAKAPFTADQMAVKIGVEVKNIFGAAAPDVELSDEIASNAIAGPSRILIRRSATFTEGALRQLINHEAHIHVATALNGREQDKLPILAASHPGTARTQEGLAVFAEFITGSMDVDRLRDLAGRVLAIQMAIEGADFLDVYRFFLERTDAPDQSFESARRVFRGGVLAGGAPFTKDIVYLDGLLRVHNFFRAAVSMGRIDALRLVFCGKLEMDHVTAMCELRALGLCKMPRFLPPWVEKLDFLVSYMAYSGFLNTVKLAPIQVHFERLFRDAPVIE